MIVRLKRVAHHPSNNYLNRIEAVVTGAGPRRGRDMSHFRVIIENETYTAIPNRAKAIETLVYQRCDGCRDHGADCCAVEYETVAGTQRVTR